MESSIVVIILLLLLVVIFIVVPFIQAAAEKAENDRQPILSVSAQVVAKRPYTGGGGVASTSYYVTFELESGDRKEFSMRGDEYGMLAERDKGILMYQGTRYRSFQRQRF